jgi:hypothetical protein
VFCRIANMRRYRVRINRALAKCCRVVNVAKQIKPCRPNDLITLQVWNVKRR